MKYIVYFRVSTEKQEDSGLGIEAQRFACVEWINKQEIKGEIVEYIDVVTGTDRKRKELEERPQLLEALSQLTCGDVLVVHKRERLGRDPYVNCMIERIIEKKKATLASAIGEMEGDEPHNVLMRRIMDAFAEYEALLISTRTRAALARKKARGERIGHVPYGYMLDSNRNLIVNPSEAETLKRMYYLRTVERLPFREIAHILNSEGYRNRSTSKRLISVWNHGSTSRVYKNYTRIYGDMQALRAG